MDKKNIFPLLMQSRWAMLPEAFRGLIQFAEKAVSSPELASVARNSEADALSLKNDIQGKTAIIPVMGPIFPQENILTLFFGGTALDNLVKDFEFAVQDKTVNRIILIYDTPGGSVTGVSELAARIYAARSQKEIISYVYGMAASAGYWLASAASKVVLSDTSQVGSIGVCAGYVDRRIADEKAGVNRIAIVSSQSPRKNMDISTDAGKAEIQKVVDQLAGIFVDSVAKYRGVTSAKVLSDFGKGGVVIGQNAANLNMADEVNTLAGLLSGKTSAIAGGKGNSGLPGGSISFLSGYFRSRGRNASLPGSLFKDGYR